MAVVLATLARTPFLLSLRPLPLAVLSPWLTAAATTAFSLVSAWECPFAPGEERLGWPVPRAVPIAIVLGRLDKDLAPRGLAAQDGPELADDPGEVLGSAPVLRFLAEMPTLRVCLGRCHERLVVGLEGDGHDNVRLRVDRPMATREAEREEDSRAP